MTGNPVAGHEFAKTMCLMAVGSSLLRIEDQGIVPEIREQAMLNSKPKALDPKPSTLSPRPWTLSPTP